MELDELTKYLLKEAEAADPDRWNAPVIKTEHRTLTKKDVFDYYSHPQIRSGILAQIRNNPSVVHQTFSLEQPVLRRNLKGGEPINITQDAGEVNDPSDYQYWIERRAVEFHPTLGEKTKTVWVDIDPKEGYSWDDTKKITHDVYKLLDSHPDILDTSIRFSGGTGFYVLGELKDAIPTDQAKQLVHKLIQHLTERPNVTTGLAGPGKVRLDLSTLKNTGSIRSIYSLNKETGLVSVPVEEEHLYTFNPEHANIEAVLGHKPKKYTPQRQ